jgi:hypothetical protein
MYLALFYLTTLNSYVLCLILNKKLVSFLLGFIDVSMASFIKVVPYLTCSMISFDICRKNCVKQISYYMQFEVFVMITAQGIIF